MRRDNFRQACWRDSFRSNNMKYPLAGDEQEARPLILTLSYKFVFALGAAFSISSIASSECA